MDASSALPPFSKIGGGIKKKPGQYLIWSNYHGAWHRRGSTGNAQGYTGDLAQAGLFDWEVASHYNDGKRGRDRLISPAEARRHIEARAAELRRMADDLALLSASFAPTPATIQEER